MENTTALQVVSVNHLPESIDRWFQQLSEKASRRPSVVEKARPFGYPLAEVQSMLGTLWLPTYLPPGFEYEGARANPHSNGRLTVAFKNSKNERLFIVTAPSANVKVKEGFVESISVGGYPGYLIQGEWVARANKNGIVREKGWDENHVLKVKFVRDGQVISVDSIPANAVSREELIKVAVSIQLG